MDEKKIVMVYLPNWAMTIGKNEMAAFRKYFCGACSIYNKSRTTCVDFQNQWENLKREVITYSKD
jgi:hypothetical protein